MAGAPLIAIAWALAALDAFLLGVFVLQRIGNADRPPWRLHEVLLLWQTLYWAGCCALLFDQPDRSTVHFAIIGLVGQLSVIAGGLIAAFRHPMASRALVEIGDSEGIIAQVVLVVASGVCAFYIRQIVQNDQLSLALASVITGDGQFLDYRLLLTQGEGIYLAPGYVKQFRDVLLPASLIALVGFTRHPRWWLVVPAWGVGATASVMSGERSLIMIYAFVLGAGLFIRPGITAAGRRAIATTFGALVFAAFMGSTILLGRASADASPLGVVTEAAAGLFERTVLTVPRENSQGFPVWGDMAPTGGRSWVSALAGVLPGKKKRGLDNDLHEFLGGGAEGNAPLALSSDAYLAFGLAGAAVAPLVFMLGLAFADRWLLESPYAFARAVRIMMVPLSLNWFSPFLFVLNGGVVFLFAAFAVRVMKARE